jgi:hypothetical protein
MSWSWVDYGILQKCFYNWWPRKCLGLEVANLVIFIPKNDQKYQNDKIFMFFSSSEEKFVKLWIFSKTRKIGTYHKNLAMWNFFFQNFASLIHFFCEKSFAYIKIMFFKLKFGKTLPLKKTLHRWRLSWLPKLGYLGNLTSEVAYSTCLARVGRVNK